MIYAKCYRPFPSNSIEFLVLDPDNCSKFVMLNEYNLLTTNNDVFMFSGRIVEGDVQYRYIKSSDDIMNLNYNFYTLLLKNLDTLQTDNYGNLFVKRKHYNDWILPEITIEGMLSI